MLVADSVEVISRITVNATAYTRFSLVLILWWLTSALLIGKICFAIRDSQLETDGSNCTYHASLLYGKSLLMFCNKSSGKNSKQAALETGTADDPSIRLEVFFCFHTAMILNFKDYLKSFKALFEAYTFVKAWTWTLNISRYKLWAL